MKLLPVVFIIGLWVAFHPMAYGQETSSEAWLGVLLAPSPNHVGVVIEDVLKGSTAMAMGVLPGDVLLTINRKDVNSPKEANVIIGRLKVSAPIFIVLNRQGQVLELRGKMREKRD